MNAALPADHAACTLEEAARTRRSIRAYLDTPVSREVIERILCTAATAPSGSNTQPWRVWALRGSALARLADALSRAYLEGQPLRPEYQHYAQPLPGLHLQRRRACGLGLYSLLEIGREDKERRQAYRVRNYRFFGAPAALVFTMNRALSAGSWLDYGMFLQTAMLAARGLGLHTCAEGSIAAYPNIVRRELFIEDSELVLCGMALGYADPAAAINRYQPARCPLDEFANFVDE